MASKVGRLVDASTGTTFFDFSRDGVLRSIEASLERLGLDRIDILHVHDPDDHLEIAVRESFPVLAELRRDGVICEIGVGTNRWQVALACAMEAPLDCLLLAGRYTLLEQDGALDQLFPVCNRAGIRVLLGGMYNSGILASGAISGARYNYAEPPARIVAKVRAIEDLCARHGISLADAAVQFPAAHPAVSVLIVGMRSANEVDALLESTRVPIPAEFWAELEHANLIDPAAPVPAI